MNEIYTEEVNKIYKTTISVKKEENKYEVAKELDKLDGEILLDSICIVDESDDTMTVSLAYVKQTGDVPYLYGSKIYSLVELTSSESIEDVFNTADKM